MRSRPSRFILLLLVIMVSLLVCPLAERCPAVSSEEFQETYEIPAGAQVTLFNRNGDVTIEGWYKDYAEVRAVKRSRRGQKQLDKVTIEVVVDGDMEIRTRYSGKPRDVSVTYEVRIPAAAMLADVKTTNGAVDVRGVRGMGELTSRNGTIRLRRSVGDFSLQTTNGSIRVKGLEGNVSGYTTNGSIKVEDAAGILGAGTTNGEISLEIRSVPEGSLEITTTNGLIEVFFDPALDADLNASTTNGSVESRDLAIIVEKVSKGVLAGRLGKGGKYIRMRTTNGDIRIRRLDR